MEKPDNGTSLRRVLFTFLFIIQFLNSTAQNQLPDSVVTERTRIIEKMLEEGKPNANRWWYGWLAGYSAATIGQGIVYISTDEKGLKQDMALGAATTLLGAAGQLLTPNEPGKSADRLSKAPAETNAERLNKLSLAEELLKNSAMREKTGRSWQMHAVTGVVNLSSGLITWIAFDRDVWSGVVNFALNTAITETQIWTQPTRAMKDYRDYCNKYKSGINPVANRQGAQWYVSGGPGTIKLKVVF